ncbi:SLAP domain-containing protein [Companilactobacillus jidongensis]|uniref:SLAP domain-containing protein n=1 Tax=Companilactobacillus jidongensis TaxID=2486006 RepID=UPI0013DDA82A|nr:SLAP domain-containing protein [Companilactobacillus jidongensis]
MRFEQLKRKPNAILRKKLYKSGKNWIVASTLAFAGGMILLGSTQVTTVKADVSTVVASGTSSQSNNSDSKENTVTKSEPVDNETSNNEPQQPANGTNTEINENTDVSTNTAVGNTSKTDTIQTTPKVEPTSRIQSTLTSTDNEAQTAAAQQVAPNAAVDTTGINDPTNLATSNDEGNSKVGKSDTDDQLGSSWYINSQNVLHIEPGTWADLDPTQYQFGFRNAFLVKSIYFDGKVTAGSKISSLFQSFEYLTDLGNMKDELDTSKTEYFDNVFTGNMALTSYDFSTLDMHNAVDVNGMFNASGLKTVDLTGVDLPKVTDYQRMFSYTNNLETANLDNFNFHSADIQNMFSYSHLNSINLSGVDASNTTNITNLFAGDANLVDLDLSDFDMNETTRNSNYQFLYFGAVTGRIIKIKSLTLNSTARLGEASNLEFNTDLYKGWVSDKNPTATPISSMKLEDLYNTPQSGTQTWSLVDKDTINYTINYFTKDQDPSKDTPVKTISDLSGIDGSRFNIPPLDGYTTPDPNTVTLDYAKGANQVFNVFVNVIEPYNLTINIHYDDDPSKDTSVIGVLQLNPTNAESDSVFQSTLDKLPNTNKTLDKDQTTINIDALVGGDYSRSISDATEEAGVSTDETNLKTIINALMDYYINNYSNFTGAENNNIDFVDAYYKTYEKPVAPDNGNHGGGSSTTEPDSEVDDVKQTSATYYDEPKVQLYGSDGNALAESFLNPNTSWYNDKKMILNGTTYYRVSTDQWVKASDVYVYTGKDTYVRVYQDVLGELIKSHGTTANRELASATDWVSDRYATIDGEKYYRVSTNEFVKASDVYEYTYLSQVVTTAKAATVYDERGNATTKQLPAGSAYKSDRFVNINGKIYYRIATNEFVRANDINL